MKRINEDTEKSKSPRKRRAKARKEQTRQFLPFDVKDWEEFKEAEWITSHLNPRLILWSNMPDKVKPNIEPSFFSHVQFDEGSKVVNTWFVDSPVQSLSAAASAAPSLASSTSLIPSLPSSDTTLSIKMEAEFPPIATASTVVQTLSLAELSADFEKAAQFVRDATAVLIVAGAGVGVDSGLPDYRGPQGFWRAYPGLAQKGLSLEEMSHPDWFMDDPQSAWGFYGHRAHLYHNAVPHAGFHILLEIAKLKKNNYFVFTSNIDSQFQVAGFDDCKVYEAHGSLRYLQCVNEDCQEVWDGTNEIPFVEQDSDSSKELRLKNPDLLPACPACKSLARPNVSMFNDNALTWKNSRSFGQKVAFLKWLRRVYGRLDEEEGRSSRPVTDRLVIIEIGCGQSLHSLRFEVELLLQKASSPPSTAASSPEAPSSPLAQPSSSDVDVPPNSSLTSSVSALPESALASAVRCIRINPNFASISPPNVGLKLGAKDALLEIAQRLNITVTEPPRIKLRRSTSIKLLPTSSISKSDPGTTSSSAKKKLKKKLEPEETDPNLCTCKTKLRAGKFAFFILCELCEKYFHNTCVRITSNQAELMPHWFCIECKEKKRLSKAKDSFKSDSLQTLGRTRRSSSTKSENQ